MLLCSACRKCSSARLRGSVCFRLALCLRSFATDAPGQLNVFRHDRDAFGVYRTQVGVFEESDQVGFRGFLQCQDGRRLEAQVRLEVLCDLTNEALEWQLADQQVRALLVLPNFSQGNCPWSVAVWLLHSAWYRFSCLRGQVLSWCLPTGRFTCSLFRAWHYCLFVVCLLLLVCLSGCCLFVAAQNSSKFVAENRASSRHVTIKVKIKQGDKWSCLLFSLLLSSYMPTTGCV